VSVVDATTRAAVEQRAEFRCEYCRLPVRGRATLLLLQMNHPNMVDIRRLLVALNLFPG
jgi:hypothetical protein